MGHVQKFLPLRVSELSLGSVASPILVANNVYMEGDAADQPNGLASQSEVYCRWLALLSFV